MLAAGRRALLLVAAPLACGALGVLVMARHEVPRSMIGLHVGVLVAGSILAAGLATRGRGWLERRAVWMAAIALVLLATTLIAGGLDGVHRWIGLGPVRLHVSSIVSPLLLAATATLAVGGRQGAAVGVLLGAQALHVMQPDAGQATALAAGGAIVVAMGARSMVMRVLGAAGIAGAGAAVWLRHDPLPAVPAVEGIVRLAGEVGAGVQGVAVVLLGLGPLALVWAAKGVPAGDRGARVATASIAAYTAATVLVSLVGNFPVPVMGFGVSPVIGTAIGAGLVAALTTREEAGAQI